jgi:hypothetical protein
MRERDQHGVFRLGLGKSTEGALIRDQLSQIGIRMNGGFPRFQAQILKKLRIPNIDNLSTDERNALIESYDRLEGWIY